MKTDSTLTSTLLTDFSKSEPVNKASLITSTRLNASHIYTHNELDSESLHPIIPSNRQIPESILPGLEPNSHKILSRTRSSSRIRAESAPAHSRFTELLLKQMGLGATHMDQNEVFQPDENFESTTVQASVGVDLNHLESHLDHIEHSFLQGEANSHESIDSWEHGALGTDASRAHRSENNKTKSLLGTPGLPMRKHKNLIYRLFHHSSREHEFEASPLFKLRPHGGASSDTESICSFTSNELVHDSPIQLASSDDHVLPRNDSTRSRNNSILSKIFHMHSPIFGGEEVSEKVLPSTSPSISLRHNEIMEASNISDLQEEACYGSHLPQLIIHLPSSPNIRDEKHEHTNGARLPHSFNVFKSHKFADESSSSSCQHDSVYRDTLTNLHSKKLHSLATSHDGLDIDNPSTSGTSTASLLAATAKSPPISLSPRGMLKSGSELEKYGKMDQVLGRGANAVVKLAHQKLTNMSKEKFYAIKEFRKRRKDESQREFVKKLVAEFCISSTLHNEHIVETIDLIHDDHGRYCEVMEYIQGGDLYSRISKNTLTDPEEINCYFKQLLKGVSYLHSVGVAHRDLKPENLLITSNGRTLKITDFGTAEVFKTCFEKNCRTAKGIHGSDPYIAPEEFDIEIPYEAAKVDVWACGIILHTMYKRTVPWHFAKNSDTHYAGYLCKRHEEGYGFHAFDCLMEGPRSILYKMLDPSPKTRPGIEDIIALPWVKGIQSCELIDKPTSSQCSASISPSSNAFGRGSVTLSAPVNAGIESCVPSSPPVALPNFDTQGIPIQQSDVYNVVRHQHRMMEH